MMPIIPLLRTCNHRESEKRRERERRKRGGGGGGGGGKGGEGERGGERGRGGGGGGRESRVLENHIFELSIQPVHCRHVQEVWPPLRPAVADRRVH